MSFLSGNKDHRPWVPGLDTSPTWGSLGVRVRSAGTRLGLEARRCWVGVEPLWAGPGSLPFKLRPNQVRVGEEGKHLSSPITCQVCTKHIIISLDHEPKAFAKFR